MAQIVKNLPAIQETMCSAHDLGSIPGLGRSPGEGKGYQLQSSGLENSMGIQPTGSQKVEHDRATELKNLL